MAERVPAKLLAAGRQPLLHRHRRRPELGERCPEEIRSSWQARKTQGEKKGAANTIPTVIK